MAVIAVVQILLLLGVVTWSALPLVEASDDFNSNGNFGVNNHHRQLAFIFDSVTGENEDEVCESFKEYYFSNPPNIGNSTMDQTSTLVDMLGTKCKCQAVDQANIGYALSCEDKNSQCYDGACGKFSVEAQLVRREEDNGRGFDVTYQKECMRYDDDSFQGVLLCEEYDFRGGGGIISEYEKHRVSINGAACQSTREELCGEEFVTKVLDCSNLGYVEEINVCNMNGAEGPFEHYYSFDPTIVYARDTSRAGNVIVSLGGLFFVNSLLLVIGFTLL